MFLSRGRRHVTMILHCHWREVWSRNTDVLIILSIISIENKKNLISNNRSKPKFFWLRFQLIKKLKYNLQSYSKFFILHLPFDIERVKLQCYSLVHNTSFLILFNTILPKILSFNIILTISS